MAGSLLAPLVSCNSSSQKEKAVRTNWAGNLEYSTENLHLPKSVEELQQMVKDCDKARALGTRHCFNTIADSNDNQISVQHLNQVVSLDEQASTVTIEAGMSYGQLCPYLHERGFALHNLASLPHISVAGACATATHGSGMRNGNLATVVTALEFIDANGALITLSRKTDPEKFRGAVVNLGGLGVLTKLTLAIQPAFQMRQDVYQFLPLSQLEENFEEIMSSGYSVSLFTDWQTDKVNQVWIKRRIEENDTEKAAPTFFGASLATKNIHPIVELSAENCTEQMGVPGPWHERLPHFRMNFTPSSGKELQTEYFVPRQHAVEAIRAVSQLKDQLGPLLMISEIRAIDADDFWMSPCYQQPCIAIHFTCEQNKELLQQVMPMIEQALQPYEARPHWGKMFAMSPTRLQSLYQKLPDFKALLMEYDPQGKFRNDFMQHYIFSSET